MVSRVTTDHVSEYVNATGTLTDNEPPATKASDNATASHTLAPEMDSGAQVDDESFNCI